LLRAVVDLQLRLLQQGVRFGKVLQQLVNYLAGFLAIAFKFHKNQPGKNFLFEKSASSMNWNTLPVMPQNGIWLRLKLSITY